MKARSGRVTASKAAPKGLPPLHLGTAQNGERETDGAAALGAAMVGDEVELRVGTEHVRLTKRGAKHLGRWLTVWANPTPTLQLWGVGGIMQECDASRRTVYRWVARDDFPKPLPVIGGNGSVWEARAVKAWVKLNRPLPGRPREQKGRGA